MATTTRIRQTMANTVSLQAPSQRRTRPWHASAAYLYLLHLEDLSLAWEYLRRNPEYRSAWDDALAGQGAPEDVQAAAWGLKELEDPQLDARDAQPLWLAHSTTGIRIRAEREAGSAACPFNFWRLPGRKLLRMEGTSISACLRWPGGCARLELTSDLQDGQPYSFALWPDRPYQQQAAVLDALALAAEALPIAAVGLRPCIAALQSMHTLQALDAKLAGASLREVAQALFGAQAANADWHADSALRARTRRLVQRGQALMRGGYRELVGFAPQPAT
jgi:hypothetical protein